ncbi:GSCOCG00012123001-RA-CDS [Cotesia congregata]|nr:GSCOCG00012123001-RA-CDS [Cotesia congregata]
MVKIRKLMIAETPTNMPEFRMKTVCAQPKKNLRARLAKLESVIDRSKRMPWTLQLLQDLYFMAQESTIHCKLHKTFFFSTIIVTQNFKRVFLGTVLSRSVVKSSQKLLNRS